MRTRFSLVLALLVACSGGESAAPPTSPASAPAAAARGVPSGPELDPSARPDVDGEIARIDITDPGVSPRPGVWTMTENALVDNTCGVEPRRRSDGPCTMGCGETTIAAVEPGVFTLQTPAIGYAGTCVLLDDGARFECKGGTRMAPAETTLGGTIGDDGGVAGTWSLVMSEDGPEPGCRMSGAFKANAPVG
jgi:hypothetical protein